jgi:ribulose kinase
VWGVVDNPLIMQIYSDVTGRPIKIATSSQATALGAAILGSVAADSDRGGHDSHIEAIRKMTSPTKKFTHLIVKTLKSIMKLLSIIKPSMIILEEINHQL